MAKMRPLFLIGLILTFGLCQVHYVPTKHSVYDVIRLIEAAHPSPVSHNKKPYTREEIKIVLLSAHGLIDSTILIRYLEEFQDNDRHTVTIQNESYYFLGDVFFGDLSQFSESAIPFHRIDVGGNIRGFLKPSLSFQTDIVTSVYLANLDFKTGYNINESLAPVKNHSFQSSASGDFSESQLIFSNRFGFVSFGSDIVGWGPAQSGHLLLDVSQFSINDIHAAVSIGPFHYTKLFGTLNNLYPTIESGGKSFLANKRKLVAHRLDIRLSPTIWFGVSESITYNRDLELAYLNPLLPFTITEVQSGDLDNNLAAIDLSALLWPGTNTYFELLVDDMDFRQNWFKDYVNKWALLVGHQWANPLGYKNTLFTAEVVRVEPYVYTHRDTANLYELYGQSIGYDLEPNSLRYYSSVQWFQKQNLWHTFTVSHTLHGDGDRIFGKPIDKKADKEFLVGTYEKRLEITYSLEYEFFENMWLMGGLRLESVKNEKIDNTMSEYGGNSDRYSVVVGLSINY